MTQHGLLFDIIHYPILQCKKKKDGSQEFHPLFILFLTFMSSVSQSNTYFSLNNQEVLKNDSFFLRSHIKFPDRQQFLNIHKITVSLTHMQL